MGCRESKLQGWALVLVPVLMWTATLAVAAVSPQEAAKLGGPELTPVGAVRAGNAEGTIPPWTGGLTTAVPGFEPGDRHPDPFGDDPVRYTITAANLDHYADKLSEGQKRRLRTYPDSWRMNVYPTRRSAAYPQFVYDALKANATRAELITQGKGGVRNSDVSSPFPIPRSGLEVIWNHNLRWRGIHVVRYSALAPVTRLGNYRRVAKLEEFGSAYAFPGTSETKQKYSFLFAAVKGKYLTPGSVAGNGALALEPLDYSGHERVTWNYNDTLKRIFRNPTIAYQFPAPETDALRTIDDFWLFNGATDRFEWNLLGKREMFIPYNAYRLHSGQVDENDILGRHHIDPELTRYELHRVWVVEAVLKPGARHIYSRRVFYIDEDSWQAMVADVYDLDGQLWRLQESHTLNFYEVPVVFDTLQVFQDFKARRYLVEGLDNHRQSARFYDELEGRNFSPISLKYYVR
ncbi:MAG: DUF1329 domain-containing protein [Gammaproteobacteria bacterium]|nr:DUF1329 domain-containing protein [Gammaproteobacteria bacterium]